MTNQVPTPRQKLPLAWVSLAASPQVPGLPSADPDAIRAALVPWLRAMLLCSAEHNITYGRYADLSVRLSQGQPVYGLTLLACQAAVPACEAALAEIHRLPIPSLAPEQDRAEMAALVEQAGLVYHHCGQSLSHSLAVLERLAPYKGIVQDIPLEDVLTMGAVMTLKAGEKGHVDAAAAAQVRFWDGFGRLVDRWNVRDALRVNGNSR
jgi:hypothetical protein